MYGSQFHAYQALTSIRPSTEALRNRPYSTPKNTSKQKTALVFFFLILVSALVANAAFAGPKESQLKGGNGGATGRP